MTAFIVDDVDVVPDEAPVTLDETRACKEPGCANEVVRKSARGRWPSYCDEHSKRSGSRASNPAAKLGGSPTNQAKQAAEVLAQIHDLIAAGLMAATLMPAVPLSMPNTYRAIVNGNEAFRVSAAEALSTDPELCKTILKVGKAGGKAALVVAYATLAIGIAPAAMNDVKDMMDDRKDGSRPAGDDVP